MNRVLSAVFALAGLGCASSAWNLADQGALSKGGPRTILLAVPMRSKFPILPPTAVEAPPVQRPPAGPFGNVPSPIRERNLASGLCVPTRLVPSLRVDRRRETAYCAEGYARRLLGPSIELPSTVPAVRPATAGR